MFTRLFRAFPEGLRKRLTPRALGAAAAALGAIVVAAAVAPGTSRAPAAPAARAVKVTTVAFSGQETRASFPGTVQPRRQAPLAFRVGGRVSRRLVDVGARVTAGTVLATLEREDLELALRSAQAQLASARADLVQADADLVRYEQIRKSPAFSLATYDKRLSTKTMAAAKVRDAEAQVKLRQNQLAYGTLVAEQDGVITAAKAEAGQVVASGEPVFTLAQAGDLEIAVSIPEARLGELKESQPFVTLWSQPGKILRATLREVGASADPTTRTYDVRYILETPPADLQIGMSATVILTRELGARVAEVPLSAVFQTGTTPTVWLVGEGGRIARRTVTVAAFRTETALIADGVKDGDVIVSAGVHRLDENQRVRVFTGEGA